MSVNVVTIQWLKEQRKISKECLRYIENKKICEADPEDLWERDILLGEIICYERIIKYMKGTP